MRARSFLVAAVLVLAAACTHEGAATEPTTTPPVDVNPPQDVDVTFVPWEWTYELYGVKAAFHWKDGPATLTVKNGSDQEVGAPDLYVVTRDQRHVDAKLDGSAPLEPSESGTYTVTFPGGLQPDDIGLVVLLLGDVNWGALGPKYEQK
jgi:hypothetical protein